MFFNCIKLFAGQGSENGSPTVFCTLPAMKKITLLLALIAGFSTGVQAQETKPVDTTPKLTFGQMIKQGEKLVFSPCRDRSYAMVEDVSTDRIVSKGLAMAGLESGKKLYVELVGYAENAVLKASGVNLLHLEGRCQLPGGSEENWRAAGSEPGWLLVVGKEHVVLKRQGKPDVMLPAAPIKPEAGVASYEVSKDNQKLAVRFEQGLCRDTMADSVFGWRATVTSNGQVLKGCAWQR